MKILLVTSPHVRHPAVLQNDFRVEPSVMYSFAPVGLLMLVAVVRQELGVEPTIYDLNRRIIDGTIPLGAEFYKNAASVLCADNPGMIGFMTECDSYHHVLAICAAIKEQRPNCIIELGGPHATAVAKATMERCPYIDAIVMGESERSFPLFLAACMASDDRPVPGVLRRSKHGRILDGGHCALVEDLNELPPPAYDVYKADPGEEIFLEVGRGCPFQCTFCSTAPYWSRRHRVKSPGRILSEIRWLIELFGKRRIHFTHDLLTTNRAWVRELCHTLIEAGTPVLWTCSARTDTVDDELLALMARAGCNAIYFGIESGSERILKEIRKDIPLNHSLEVLRICRKHGITPNAGFIVGFPSEDEQSLSDTFTAFTQALQDGCKPTHLFGFCPFAGSSIYKTLKDMECTGHFLDLPLGQEMENANRKIVAGDADLFGAYFRPQLLHLVENGNSLIAGIDEFSPLVDAAIQPCLMLARAKGGMFALYKDWVSWIVAHNNEREAAPYRRYYGSPVDFCDFLIENLEQNLSAPAHAVSLAQVIRMNLLLAAKWQGRMPTTMTNHRSVLMPMELESVELGTQLSLGNVVAKLEVAYDVREMLSTSVGDELHEPAPSPIFLVWQVTQAGDLRLVEVDEVLFHLIDALEQAPSTAAELIANSQQSLHPSTAAFRDFFYVLDILNSAVTAGLVCIKEPMHHVSHK